MIIIVNDSCLKLYMDNLISLPSLFLPRLFYLNYLRCLADNQFGKRDNESGEGSLAEERESGEVSSEWKSATARGTKAACLTGIDPVPGIKLSRCSKPVMACPSGTR